MFMQHLQVELHQVPADDRIRIVPGQPIVEGFEQFATALSILEVEVDLAGIAIRRPEHVHLAFTTPLHGNGVQLAAPGGFDIQGSQFQSRAVVRGSLELGIEQRSAGIRRAGEQHRRGDETLHQETLGWADIGFVDIHAALAQQLLDVHQLAMLLAVQAEHRAVMEIQQLQCAQLHAPLAAQQAFSALALFCGNERHRGLRRQTHMAGTVVGRQPEFDLRTRGGVAPMPGQDKTLL